MKAMTSGQLAKSAGVNLESIRFYEREGLLPQAPRSGAGYRLHSLESVSRLRFIKRAQELGFTLREIKELLELRFDPDAPCADVRRRAQDKLADIDKKIADLKRMRKTLSALAAACPGKGAVADCPILESLDSANPVA
jgi:MerR family transcriptional regulator, copper efflux regulator